VVVAAWESVYVINVPNGVRVRRGRTVVRVRRAAKHEWVKVRALSWGAIRCLVPPPEGGPLGGGVTMSVNVASAVVVVPALLVAMIAKWYVAPGVSPMSGIDTADGEPDAGSDRVAEADPFAGVGP
jgi:hypothetical protein